MYRCCNCGWTVTFAHNYTIAEHPMHSHLLQIAAKLELDSATRVPSSPTGKREKKPQPLKLSSELMESMNIPVYIYLKWPEGTKNLLDFPETFILCIVNIIKLQYYQECGLLFIYRGQRETYHVLFTLRLEVVKHDCFAAAPCGWPWRADEDPDEGIDRRSAQGLCQAEKVSGLASTNICSSFITQ